jgi:preprotein translocase subunit SecA
MSSPGLKPGVLAGLYPQKQQGLLSPWVAACQNQWALWRSFFSRHQYRLSWLRQAIATFEKDLPTLDDDALHERVQQLRPKLLRDGLKRALVLECFALVREMADRRLGLRPYDEQLLAGWVMINGALAEMRTGEGKTLSATLPACTAALAGIPVHVITSNDYLVQRDAQIMRPLYEAMGVSVSVVTSELSELEKRQAYCADVVYVTGNQLGFDYLRDRISSNNEESLLSLKLRQLSGDLPPLLLRGLCFAIVDEADSVLVDQARTPLLIARNRQDDSQADLYRQALDIARDLEVESHYLLDRRQRKVSLTDEGKQLLSFMPQTSRGFWAGAKKRNYLVCMALQALCLYQRDRHYLVRDGRIEIIDEHTGRAMPDRGLQFGLQQMIELKEGCDLSAERDVQASISYQRFFSRYMRLGGMSGTLQESADELRYIYGLSIQRIPTHRKDQLIARPVQVYLRQQDKWLGVLETVEAEIAAGRAVLIGTYSLASSEYLSDLLTNLGIPHQLLTAKQDQAEADIIESAGQPGAVTVATNMAGRGTDISLAGSVKEAGGLTVIASECNDSSRIDRQLFGRAARQGDPGSYVAILSLHDRSALSFWPRWLMAVVSRCFGQSCLPRWLGYGLVRLPQRRLENYHRKIRYRLWRGQQGLKQLLAFSGRQE